MDFLNELKLLGRQISETTFVFNEADELRRGYVQIDRFADGVASVHRIWANSPGHGVGSQLLRTLCELADRHRVQIALRAVPFGAKPYPMTQADLDAWYRRHGFEGGRKLIRQPRVQKAA